MIECASTTMVVFTIGFCLAPISSSFPRISCSSSQAGRRPGEGREKAQVVPNCDHLFKLKFSKSLPYAFTGHGALMAGEDEELEPLGSLLQDGEDSAQSALVCGGQDVVRTRNLRSYLARITAK
jgi:hypothetical protein